MLTALTKHIITQNSPVQTDNDNHIALMPFGILGSLNGMLPNGEAFTWSKVSASDIPAILALQDTVADAATGLEKTFLIKRTESDYLLSFKQKQLYWGAWVNGQLVGLFGMADNDDEVGDGRGAKTPKDALGVTQYKQVSILKGAQVHPGYRDQGLGALGALVRYQHFVIDPQKKVMMTKIHAGNVRVAENYLKNGFTEACRTSVTDRGETFDVVTYKVTKEILKSWLDDKTASILARFTLNISKN